MKIPGSWFNLNKSLRKTRSRDDGQAGWGAGNTFKSIKI